MSKRNIFQQFEWAIEEAFKPGIDKHALKNGMDGPLYKVCSFGEKMSLQELAHDINTFMKTEYTAIKFVRDIKTEEIQSYLDLKSSTCSTSTIQNYASRIHKLELLCRNQFKIDINWHDGLKMPTSLKTPVGQKQRVQSMDLSDYNKILKYGYQHSRSLAIPAFDLSGRYSLRVHETTRLKRENVDFEKMIITVIGKGGRRRMLKIEQKDEDFLKALCKNKKPAERLIPLQPESVNRAIRRIMKKIRISEKYPLTTIHAVRKGTAQEIYDEQREMGKPKKEAEDFVSARLGHGHGRSDISRTYIANRH